MAARSSELRLDSARLSAQQRILGEELQRSEHEARMNSIESEETRRSMAVAVRELVPLRQETADQRAELKEARTTRRGLDPTLVVSTLVTADSCPVGALSLIHI